MAVSLDELSLDNIASWSLAVKAGAVALCCSIILFAGFLVRYKRAKKRTTAICT